MAESPRALWVGLVFGLAVPGIAAARPRGEDTEPPARKRHNPAHSVRWASYDVWSERAPGGRHVAELVDGNLIVDGRRRSGGYGGAIVGSPIWRNDGEALAWLERAQGSLRLVVLPVLDPAVVPMVWPLPLAQPGDQVFWAGEKRLVIGQGILQPRLMASWE